MRIRSWIFGIVMVAILGTLVASWRIHVADAKQDNKITAVGSTALQPLVEQAAYDYQKKNTKVNITVQGGGSGTGLSQVQGQAVAIGNSDVFASQQTGIRAADLKDHQVAVVGITPVINPAAGVTNVSMTELQQIFTGDITNWKEVGGNDQAITVINRAQGSGTRLTFENAVLKGQEATKSQEQDSNGTVQKIVGSTPGAISYVAFSYVNGNLRALFVDGVRPTAKNVTTNRWQIWSYEHMYTHQNGNQTTEKFIKYIQSAPVQRSLVTKLGYISIHDMKVNKNVNGEITQR